jgi:hypothetical protein
MTPEDRDRIITALGVDAHRMGALASKIDGGEARNDSQRSRAAWALRDEASECRRLAAELQTAGSLVAAWKHL